MAVPVPVQQRPWSWSFTDFFERLLGPEVYPTCTPICAKEDITLEGSNVQNTVKCKPVLRDKFGISNADVLCRDSPEYEVFLNNDGHTPLGIRIGSAPDGLKILKLLSHGAILEWNAEHPREAVQPGDTIIELNGIRAIGDMMQDLRGGQPLKLRIRRFHFCSPDIRPPPRQDCLSYAKNGPLPLGGAKCGVNHPISSPRPNETFTIHLENPRALPIGLQITNHDDGLLVLKIRENGLINSWNSCNPLFLVYAGDILLQVNQLEDKLKMMHELNHATKLEVKLRRANFFDMSSMIGSSIDLTLKSGRVQSRNTSRQFSMETMPSMDCATCVRDFEEMEVIETYECASKASRPYDEENPSEFDGLLRSEPGIKSGGFLH